MKTPELPGEITVAGWFKAFLPTDGQATVAAEGDAIELTLDPAHEPMYVIRYPLRSEYSLDQGIPEEEVTRFRDTGITRSVKEILGSSIERGEINGAGFARLVAQVSEDHWWLARTIAKPGASTYSLMHCHGDRKLLAPGVAVATEFYLVDQKEEPNLVRG